MDYIENKTFDEIVVGDSATLVRTLTVHDINLFAVMSGDVNPANVDAEFAKDEMFHEVIAHGMWGGALISAVLGTELPGPGTIYLKQSLSFRKPVGIGDTISVKTTVTEKIQGRNRLIISCECRNQDGNVVIEGIAEVLAPTTKIRRQRVKLPEVLLHERGAKIAGLLKSASQFKPVNTLVVYPCNRLVLESAIEAANQQLIKPVLIGPETIIRQIAREADLALNNTEIIEAEHGLAAIQLALQLIREGKAEAVMKGSLDTIKFLADMVKRETGLRTDRLMSHIFVMDVPHYAKLLLISDAEINIAPSLQDKADIVQNAIDLAQALGIPQPRVAILSAVEEVNPKIPSTVDAAALCKMADRGQISGGLVEGPLGFDNAISQVAADAEIFNSTIAGNADIVIAPDLEAGAMIAKQLVYLARAEAAGLVVGGNVPIILSRKTESVATRLASCALAKLFVNQKSQLTTSH